MTPSQLLDRLWANPQAVAAAHWCERWWWVILLAVLVVAWLPRRSS